MLYEMIAVVRPGKLNEVKEIARKASSLILSRGGIIRSITNWGPFLLTKPVKKNQTRYDSGHHFLLRFDASPQVQREVRKTVAIDPRMVRCGVVKMAEGLRGGCEVGARVPWRRTGRPGGFGGDDNLGRK